MKRELKFRAWDGENMHEVLSLLGTNFCKVNKKSFPYSENITVKDVMQYIGLKDQNGKEIYEGDIVLFDFRFEDAFAAEILFDEFCWKVKFTEASTNNVMNPDYLMEYVDSNSDYELTIIGNVYQNNEDEK